MTGRRLGLAAAVAGLLLAAAATAPVRGEEDARRERAKREVEDLFRRAGSGEELSADDQRLAQRLLRDWRLSERSMPSNERRTEEMLLAMAEGRPLPPELAERAQELHRACFSSDGNAGKRRPLTAAAQRGQPGEEGRTAAGSIGDWFLLGVSVLILVSGVAVSAYARRRRRPDRSVYYQ
ncbi:MAG TPA: hypothetical protein PK280_19560 [Planctomycetota bacterium]|nr:hypothetical protein [Planctomycetota bacterium]